MTGDMAFLPGRQVVQLCTTAPLVVVGVLLVQCSADSGGGGGGGDGVSGGR